MKRALLAEDDPTSRAFLREALALLGWRVEAFASGEDAVAAAVARGFDVLLLDLNLPGADGVEVLRRIRNHDHHACADTPALALTADARPDLHQRLKQQGFDAVACKPLSLAQLERALATLDDEPEKVTAPASRTDPARAASALPIWDDAQALATLGGNREALAALRRLMLDDLPGQRDRILADPATPAARTELHRLRAACGFCGAARLGQAVAEMEDAAPGPTYEAASLGLAAAIAQTLASPRAQTD